jgi:hypothetical protein
MWTCWSPRTRDADFLANILGNITTAAVQLIIPGYELSPGDLLRVSNRSTRIISLYSINVASRQAWYTKCAA